MSEWKKVELDSICAKKIQSISSTDDFDIEYVDISSVDNQLKCIISYKTINIKEAPSRAKQILQKNDILVSTVRPNLNAVAINQIASENVVVGSTGYSVLRCNDKVDVNYLFNYCKSNSFISGLVKVAKGASYPAVSNTDVKKSKIPLPPLDIQKKIAKTLDTTAELLTMRKQQLVELDNLIKSTFYDMFGDPVTNEKGWAELSIGDVLDLQPKNGLYKPQSKYGSGTKIIRIDSFYDGYVENIRGLKKVELSLTEIEQYAVRMDDILINRVNSIEYLGKIGVVPEISEDIVYESNMMRFRLNQALITPIYLMYLWRTDFVKTQVLTRAKHAVNQSSINQQDVLSFVLLSPPISLQNQFANIVIKVEEQKTLVKKAIDETQYLFDSLMSEYFD
ncbi:restriction endonuclease subunit S [Paenibacillus sp. 1P07SE]|uniref:restriction endonuclease subunit S n=1 Tax=Paenibacillus sp. 1P07SE TaxID=3132209 RepID=UPI0039A6605E